jgi:hypothetical protein
VLLLGDRASRRALGGAATAVVAFGASIPLYTHSTRTFELQFSEQLPWIPALHSTITSASTASRCR